MIEMDLHSIHIGGEETTKRLWQMIKKPQPIEKELKRIVYSRPVEVWKTSLVSERFKGTVQTNITSEGFYGVEVTYNQDYEADNSTYTEETLHLLQALLNPIYFQEVEIREKVRTELNSLGLETLPRGLATIYTSSFLQNVNDTMISFADSVEVPSIQKHFLSERALLGRLFTRSLESPGLFLENSIILKVVTVAKQWAFDILTDSEKDSFIEETELEKKHVDQWQKMPTDKSVEELITLNDAQTLERTPVMKKVKEVLQHIVERINVLSDEEIHLLFSNLGLSPLLALENYTIVRDFLSKSDPTHAKLFLDNYIQTADSARLEKVHYLLRPTYYSDYHVSNVDWLNTQEDQLRRAQLLDRLKNYSQDDLARLLVQFLDEEISQLWIEGEAEHAVLTHPMFWDVSDNSSLTTNPEYIRRNTEAIRAALASGEVELPSVLTEVTKMKNNEFLLHPYEIAQQHDPQAALLIENIQDEKRRRALSVGDTWKIFATRVSNYLNTGIEILLQNPSIPSFNYLIERLLGISYMQQEYTTINTLNNFLAELTAKSVKMYLLNQKVELGEMYESSYPFLLTSNKPKVRLSQSQPQSIWEELVDQIINTLKNTDEDGELILRILKAKDINEVAEIVGYRFIK
jgi:hypothetical protein